MTKRISISWLVSDVEYATTKEAAKTFGYSTIEGYIKMVIREKLRFPKRPLRRKVA